MADNYLVWMHSNKVKHGCVLGKLSGVEKVFRLKKGVPMAENFPVNAEYSLHMDFPDNLVLTDSLINSDTLIVASPKLRNALEQAGAAKVEYLPVAIRDHKGKILSREYHIAHPVETVDCIDREASGARPSPILPANVDGVDKLVLRDDQIPADRQLFRITGFPDVTIIRCDLAESLDKAGLTGFRWLEPSSYPEI